MTDDIEKQFKQGIQLAGECTVATDGNEKARLMAEALGKLVPLARDYQIPMAALSVGLLANHMARYCLGNPALDDEEKLQFAHQYFAKAAEYYELAGDMPDVGDYAPARALNALAELHTLGVLGDGEKDYTKALQLYHRAADMNFAEAQMNLAIMFYRGEGTDASLAEAKNWMEKAGENAGQLPDIVQQELKEMLLQITAEYSAEPKKPATGSNGAELDKNDKI